MIDSELIQQVSALLSTFLPYLMSPNIDAGKDAAIKALGGKVVEEGWKKAVDIWKKILPEGEQKTNISEALKDMTENINDPEAKAALTWQLKKSMTKIPPDIIEEIRNIVNGENNKVHIINASNGSVAIGGNALGNIIFSSRNSYQTIEQIPQLDEVDFSIMQAIEELGISIPSVDRIKMLVNIDAEELGARLGVLDSKGFVKALYGSYSPGSLPNGVYAAGLTDQGTLILKKKIRK